MPTVNNGIVLDEMHQNIQEILGQSIGQCIVIEIILYKKVNHKTTVQKLIKYKIIMKIKTIILILYIILRE